MGELLYKGTVINGGQSVLSLTKAEYEAEKAKYDASDCLIRITDDDMDIPASAITYDNSESKLTAENVQDAVDEIAEKKQSITDSTLSTVSKTIPGAINELEKDKSTWAAASGNNYMWFGEYDVDEKHCIIAEYNDGFKGLQATMGSNQINIPCESKSAVSEGTATSLVTTGEKYTWNAMQPATDNSLATTAKTIVGAIGEVKATADSAASVADTVSSKMGSTDISSIGDGTATGAIKFFSPGAQTTGDIVTYIKNSGLTFGAMGFAGATDAPSNDEFCVFWFGSKSRIKVIAMPFANGVTMYVRDIFGTVWYNSWTQII